MAMSRELDTIRHNLASRAGELGFALFGVAEAAYSSSDLARWRDWYDAGHAADMHYLGTRRDLADPMGLQTVLPGVSRVIMLGLPYRHKAESDTGGPRGRVSFYATGRDYHHAFRTRQKTLIRYLTDLGDTPRAYVDHGPVWERLLAWKAGLGFIGKNGCLINPRFGSYVFLGAILTRLALPVDSPHPGKCDAACVRCLRACPTKALVAPAVLDARRCISYHTVENRAEIPRELRPRMGAWILGCDHCQLGCPYNRQAPNTDLPDFLGTRLPLRPQLLPFIERDDLEFRARYAGNAAMRPGSAAMARNAAIAAGNYLFRSGKRDKAFIARLAAAFEREQNPVVREALAWALEQRERPER